MAKFTAILRLLEMIPFNRRSEAYIEKLIQELTDEGYDTEANLVDEKLRWLRGENVALATMDSNEYRCPNCLTIMKYRGDVCLSNPPRYPFVCPCCGNVEYKDTINYI